MLIFFSYIDSFVHRFAFNGPFTLYIFKNQTSYNKIKEYILLATDLFLLWFKKIDYIS